MSDQINPTQEKLQLPLPTNAMEVPSLYTNSMEMVIAGVDARLMFNEVLVEAQHSVWVQRKANLVMSIDHLRLVYSVIRQNLEEFERQANTLSSANK